MSLDPPRNPQPPNPQPPNQPPLTPPVDDSLLRRILPGILSAAAVLGLLLVLLFVVLPRVSHVPRAVQNPPLPSSNLPSSNLPSSSEAVLPPADPAAQAPPAVPPAQATTAATQVPLSVTLYSAGSGKHVPVGKTVQISAYAILPPAGSATIAIAYTRNGGPRSLLTLAQGSLSTASWTPTAPGHYDFTASASDSRKISVFSRHLTIDADTTHTAARPLPPPAVSPAPEPVKTAPVRAVHVHRPAPSHLAARRVPPSHLAARRVPPRRPAPQPQSRQASQLKAPHSKAYHVAAAAFVVRPLAETFAGALRRRGFHAFVRVIKQPHHKPTYTVETGDFLHSPDAQKQAGTLKRDGYPAFVSQGH